MVRTGELGLKSSVDYEQLKSEGQTYYDLNIQVRVSVATAFEILLCCLRYDNRLRFARCV